MTTKTQLCDNLYLILGATTKSALARELGGLFALLRTGTLRQCTHLLTHGLSNLIARQLRFLPLDCSEQTFQDAVISPLRAWLVDDQERRAFYARLWRPWRFFASWHCDFLSTLPRVYGRNKSLHCYGHTVVDGVVQIKGECIDSLSRFPLTTPIAQYSGSWDDLCVTSYTQRLQKQQMKDLDPLLQQTTTTLIESKRAEDRSATAVLLFEDWPQPISALAECQRRALHHPLLVARNTSEDAWAHAPACLTTMDLGSYMHCFNVGYMDVFSADDRVDRTDIKPFYEPLIIEDSEDDEEDDSGPDV